MMNKLPTGSCSVKIAPDLAESPDTAPPAHAPLPGPRNRLGRGFPFVLLLAGVALTGVLGACLHSPAKTPAGAVNHFADIPSDDLRSTLADLARGNSQKVELAFYADLPWKGVVAPFDGFYKQMGTDEKQLSSEIEAWAKKNHVDLTFHYSKDIAGDAQKILEAREEKLVRGDSKADFTRDTLMQMYQDYEWQISEAQALLPHVKDPELKAYLDKSLKIHTAGSDQIIGLLKRFKAS